MLTDSTRIRIFPAESPGFCRDTTWGEFAADNRDDPGVCVCVQEQIKARGEALIGGGAAQLFKIVLVGTIKGFGTYRPTL